MDKKILLVFVWVAFSLSGFSNESVNSNQTILLGVDNWSLPQDSMALMNSLLIDYQVDYDIAIALANPMEIANALHKVGLVYYHLGQYDLATNYSWRLLNVANKYNLTTNSLYAYAMLVKIHAVKGQNQKSKRYLQKYQQTLSLINQDSINMPFLADDGYQVLDTQQDSVSVIDENPVIVVASKVALKDLEVKSGMLDQKVWWFIVLGLVLFSLLLAWRKGALIQSNVHIYEANSEERVASELKPQDKLAFVSPPAVGNQEPKAPLVKVVPISVNQEPKIQRQKQKQVILGSGIRKDPESKKKRGFQEIVQKAIMKSKLKSIEFYSHELEDDATLDQNDSQELEAFIYQVLEYMQASVNINNASIQLINSSKASVVMFLINPVSKSEKILALSELLFLSKIFSDKNDFQFVYSNVIGGMLKLTLKKIKPTK
ncbi:MAG: hypothetical protein ACI9GM_000874 [Salibacteraceae bacterium]|jgi:hypothetical protein